MKTEIKIKELLNILDPSKDGFQYNGELIIVDFDKLAEYVNYPKKMKVFDKNVSNVLNFYKNVALYIINENQSIKKYIDLDLNEAEPIKDGIFEYIKSIYNKEKSIIVNIPEIGDNELLIKGKKLIDIELSDDFKNLNIEKAIDINLGQLDSIFSNTRKITKDKIIDQNSFSWKESNEDLFSDKDFLLIK